MSSGLGDTGAPLDTLAGSVSSPRPAEPLWVAPSTDTPKIGDCIDAQYWIRGVLGSGGMGTVYLAHDQQLDRNVAIKLIHANKLGKGEIVDGFLAEARAMARVRHPNVVTIHAFGQRDGHPYFAMEYVKGENLSTWQQRRPELGPAEALEVLDSLARGVQAIHDAGAVHRDLKPGNVLVSADGRVAVTDFGLARVLGRDLTRERMPLSGTPAYIAPEIVRGDLLAPELLTRIDVYALGVIAFELLTGALPFDSELVQDLLNQHVLADPPRASEVQRRLPTAFDEPLQRALAKDPAARPSSAADLVRALREALGTNARAETAPLRLLVVDDEPSTLVVMRELLELTFDGAEVVTLSSAASALAVAGRERFDLIITDLNMPDGGGLGLTAALRADPATARVPIVVVTAFGGASDWHELRGHGADRILVKPVDIDVLTSVVRSLTGRTEA